MKSEVRRGVRWLPPVIIAAFSAAVLLAPATSEATPVLSMGTVLANYAVVSVGPSASLTVNSGPITGMVLIGDGSNATSSGGGSGGVTGGVDVSPPVTGDDLQHLQNPPSVNIVSSSVGTTAFSDAAALSAAASAQMVTQTFGAINGTQTITGDGGLNVIDIASLQNPKLTISGDSSDVFVFNVSGLFNTNEALTLNGVTASQLLWNLTGSSGNIFQTSGGDTLYGTFLATNGGDFQFSALNLTGELINTAGHIQFVSNSSMTASPFLPPSVPEPASWLLFLAGCAGLLLMRHRGGAPSA